MTNAEHVAQIGCELFGEHWAAPLARLAAVNVRTCQRIRASIIAGEENANALGVLRALQERIAASGICELA